MPVNQFFAHHFSPYKKIGNAYIDTLYFNAAIIWLMIMILFISLYFDVLKRLLRINN
ncbi:MAG: hypothetical protein ACK4GL_05420 [Flavobacteriales bacterium]